MRRPRLRQVLLGLGFLLWLVAGLGLWFDWLGWLTPPLLLVAGALVHGPDVVRAWRERTSKPPEPAERVLRHYPTWW
ncbi:MULTISPECIES: hypothetical protein [Micromonospora]|uniref:hypothetical protein n=1 Tax=Micromonospora TaxID=1873 RepID=UPI000F88663D|nr:hypothetical protein [Verrucosispora sp. FIM060022]RUL94020.1 hypothetical protein EG812_10175 [Verrucosispora sp. FIM060022]